MMFAINHRTASAVLSLAVIGLFALLLPLTAPASTLDHSLLIAQTDGVRYTEADAHGRFRYLIHFSEPGLLEQHRREGEGRFASGSPEARVRRDALMVRQAEHLQSISGVLSRVPQVSHRFLMTHSGMAVWLTPDEAQALRTLPEIVSVAREQAYELNTYRGPTFIGADTIWDGSNTPGNVELRGEGMVVATLDTGVNPGHPSFANDPACGHGVGGTPDKLLSFLDCASTDVTGLCNGPSPQDVNGHGSHTTSTAAGNRLDGSDTPAPGPPAPYEEIAGVAPCAHVRAYKVCPTSCPGAHIHAGIDSILIHGDVDAMNFSISGGNSPWTDNDRRKLDLVDAGVFVAASAGNTSTAVPDPVGNVNHRGPWVLSVANVTHDENVIPLLWATGPGAPPDGTQNIVLTPGSTTPPGSELNDFPIRRFTDQPETAEGCTPGTDGAPSDMNPFPVGFFDNAAALIRRGTCPFTTKITNAFDAGAELVLIANHLPGNISMDTTGAPAVPAYSMLLAPGATLTGFVEDNPGSSTIDFNPEGRQGDILASSSLRGPTPAPLQDLTKPDIAAPGTMIYAAVPGGYANFTGTSMSSPHAAGAAALVRQARPDWTPPEVMSALMTTASKAGFKDDGPTAWDWDDIGSGRVDLGKATLAGLVMHETTANYLSANPATGGDVKTLNLPSVRNLACHGCSWQRTVRNTLNVATTWNVSSVTPPSGSFEVSVEPEIFHFSGDPAELQEITITATPTIPITDSMAFGQVVFSEAGGLAPDQHITMAIKGLVPGTVPPEIELVPEAVEGSVETTQMATGAFGIGNLGDLPLEWSLQFVGESTSSGTDGVIWDQFQSSGSGIVSDFFIPMDTGAYSADDFVLAADVELTHVQAVGFINSGSLNDASEIAWFIFPDDNGVPAGNPETSPETAVWSHAAAPGGAGVSIAGNNLALDIVAATGGSLELPAGQYWMSVFPSLPVDASDANQRWNWHPGAPIQAANAKLIAPGGAFGGIPEWTDIAALTGNPAFNGLAFTLRGNIVCQSEPPGWLGVDPLSGTVAGGATGEVELTFDASDLGLGEYETMLCLQSNAANSAQVLVPVHLTVTELTLEADLVLDLAAESDFVPQGDPIGFYLTVHNAGPRDVTGAQVFSSFDDGISNLQWSCVAGGPGDSCTSSGNGQINQLVSVEAGSEVTFLVEGIVAQPDSNEQVTGTAIVFVPDGQLTDPDQANNLAQITVQSGVFKDNFE